MDNEILTNAAAARAEGVAARADRPSQRRCAADPTSSARVSARAPQMTVRAATDDPADTTEQKLRRQAQRYRLRARDASSKAERYARELFTARLAALDMLADPSDMTFDLELLDEPDALAQAVAELVKRKPHLAKRLASGDIGQGAGAGGNPGDVSLVSLINGTGRAR